MTLAIPYITELTWVRNPKSWYVFYDETVFVLILNHTQMTNNSNMIQQISFAASIIGIIGSLATMPFLEYSSIKST